MGQPPTSARSLPRHQPRSARPQKPIHLDHRRGHPQAHRRQIREPGQQPTPRSAPAWPRLAAILRLQWPNPSRPPAREIVVWFGRIHRSCWPESTRRLSKRQRSLPLCPVFDDLPKNTKRQRILELPWTLFELLRWSEQSSRHPNLAYGGFASCPLRKWSKWRCRGRATSA